MRKKREKKVILTKNITFIAWDMLQKKMQKLNLSEAE